ncbi:MAG: TRAP transporter small permease subunit [Sneathiella sp.]|nr:TRAP transporter small permease subunit [Sneathiella sp.]
MTRLEFLSRGLDRFSSMIGKCVSWLALVMVLVQFALVLARYVFGIGSVALQETVIYSFALLFLLGSADTLRRGGHVRIDIFYARAGDRLKAAIDLCGSLFLLTPVCLAVFILSWPYVAGSWEILEGSRESSGLPLLFALKSVLLLFCVMMILQGLSTILRSLLTFRKGA